MLGSESSWQQPVMLWWPGTHVLQRTCELPQMDTVLVMMTTCSVAVPLCLLLEAACTLANAYSLVPGHASVGC